MLISQTYPEGTFTFPLFGVYLCVSFSNLFAQTDDSGTPGTGAPISDINFTGSKTTISVDSSAHGLVVDCGACSGTWDFSELTVTGGEGNSISADDASVRFHLNIRISIEPNSSGCLTDHWWQLLSVQIELSFRLFFVRFTG